MKTIYADDMFVLNLIIDYFILLATAKLCTLPLRRKRFALSAAFGALYAMLLLWPRFQALATPAAKLGLGAVMTLIAYGVGSGILKPYFVFLVVSASFGGAVYAASLLAGVDTGDGLFVPLSMRVLVLSFAACYCALTFYFRHFSKRAARETHFIEVQFVDKTAVFTALTDTGNELYDPVSGLPVMVIGKREVEKLLPPVLSDALVESPAAFMEALPFFSPLQTRFRLVPYAAVGQRAALLPVFRPDSLKIDGKPVHDLLVGLAPNEICGTGDFSAVL